MHEKFGCFAVRFTTQQRKNIKVGITKPRQEFAEVKVISVHYDF